MKKYQCHRSWNCWNVLLWLHNNAQLYRVCVDVMRSTKNRREAAKIILEQLTSLGITRTPNGGRYNQTAIYHAIEWL